MKKWILVVLCLLMTLPAAQAGIGGFLSWWDSKDYDALYGGGVQIGMEVFSGIGVLARASYFTADDDDFDLSVIPLEAILVWKWNVSEAISPYIGAGIGYYIKDLDWDNRDDWDVYVKDNSCIGYFGLAGAEIRLGPVTLFGEAKYNLIDEDDELTWRGKDLKEKYSLDGLSANIGLKFGF